MSSLITEVHATSLEVLHEEVNGQKKLFVEGVFLQSNMKNRNGRIYPPSIMEREVEKYKNSHIATNRAWGELNHPPTPTINLDRVSHRTMKLERAGDNWVGKAMIVETPMGQIARQLIESGGNLGTSSRGLGSLKKNAQGIMEVQDDFRLMVAGDLVSDPSAPDAFVNGVMEGVFHFNEGTGLWILAQEIEEEVHAAPKSQHADIALAAWEKLLLRLANT